MTNHRPKILIVDDTPENLDVLQGLLKDEYKLFAAPKGVIALQIAKKQIPDLILLDIMMPEMDGYEVCQRLKADELTKDIPVIFITAKIKAEDELKGFEVGGVDYITKPISPPIVLARVKSQLALKREKELLKENMRLREDVDRITKHDLKTPLNSIISYPKMIEKENLNDKQKDQLNKISTAGHKLLNMINLSLDLYKMEQGTYSFNPHNVDIISVINDILIDNRMYILSNKFSIEMEINGEIVAKDTDITFEIPGETLLFYSTFANLIKNALEASKRKETISIILSDNDDFNVSIKNMGVVPADFQSSFFSKYATLGKDSGTGLGTYSARLITETQGGSIWMDSSEDDGTTVSLKFPKN